MARFQAQTSGLLEVELEDLRRHLGLRANQKAELLRELAVLASWVVQQTEQGRIVEARGADGVQQLVHPVIERVRHLHGQKAGGFSPIELDDEEVRVLAEVLDRGYQPTPALSEALSRLTAHQRTPPTLRYGNDEG